MNNVFYFTEKKPSSLLMHFASSKFKLIRRANQRKGKYHKEPMRSHRKTIKLRKAQETTMDQIAICFNFDFDWLRDRQRFYRKRSKAKEKHSLIFFWASIILIFTLKKGLGICVSSWFLACMKSIFGRISPERCCIQSTN